jgi:peptidoglycan/LPS O-acetylase OafA/YrhL
LTEGPSLTANLKAFYARRTLRIFPLYYAFLTVVFLAGELEAPKWHYLYLTDIYVYMTQTWPIHIEHFWTLSVEEQFYLLFPALLYLTHRRLRPGVVILALIACEISRFTLINVSRTRFDGQLPVIAGLPLLTGCLAGMWELAGPRGVFGSPSPRLLWVGLILLVTYWLDLFSAGILRSWHLQYLYHDFIAVGCALIVLGLWQSGGVLSTILSLAPIVYFGRISYGLYVFHLPVLVSMRSVVHGRYKLALFALVGTIAVSALSWHLFESPILRLKSRFPYSKVRLTDLRE